VHVLRRLLTARWLLGLVLAIAAAAVMVRLGQWQLGRGEQSKSLQNYAYAVEWLLFAAFTLFCFYKLFREADAETVEEPARPELVVPPPVTPEPQDDELAAYNAYLAQLNARSDR